MKDTSYPARLPRMLVHWPGSHAALPLDELPSWRFEETIAQRAYVAVCNSARPLAVYRSKPDTNLRRLKRWPKVLDRYLA